MGNRYDVSWTCFARKAWRNKHAFVLFGVVISLICFKQGANNNSLKHVLEISKKHVLFNNLNKLYSENASTVGTLNDRVAVLQVEVDEETTEGANNNSLKHVLEVDYEVARFFRQNQSIGLVVLVMSARNDVERRNTIRKTWALEHTNVFFIVGNRACGIPFNHRVPWTCSVKSTPTKSAQRQHNASMDTEDALLAMETQNHADLILVPIVDFYRALPHKLREAYHWALENTNAKWFVKIDDDSYVRVGELEAVARAEWVDIGYTMMAAGFSKGGVVRKGKWAETKYVPNTYPLFPSGAGHAVNRALASFVDNATLVAYQGEDTSMGIWMDEAPFVPTLLKHSTFESHGGNCFNSKKTVIGHNIPTKKILKCFEKTEMHEGVISEKAT